MIALDTKVTISDPYTSDATAKTITFHSIKARYSPKKNPHRDSRAANPAKYFSTVLRILLLHSTPTIRPATANDRFWNAIHSAGKAEISVFIIRGPIYVEIRPEIALEAKIHR
jgi:hypothetical protein